MPLLATLPTQHVAAPTAARQPRIDQDVSSRRCPCRWSSYSKGSARRQTRGTGDCHRGRSEGRTSSPSSCWTYLLFRDAEAFGGVRLPSDCCPISSRKNYNRATTVASKIGDSVEYMEFVKPGKTVGYKEGRIRGLFRRPMLYPIEPRTQRVATLDR